MIAAIDGGVAAIHQEGALAGLHCCGNTDWSLVLATGVDVINFDAWEFAQGLSVYPAELISLRPSAWGSAALTTGWTARRPTRSTRTAGTCR